MIHPLLPQTRGTPAALNTKLKRELNLILVETGKHQTVIGVLVMKHDAGLFDVLHNQYIHY